VSVAAFITAQRAQHGVPTATACRALGVSPAWYYKWRDGDPSPRRARRAALAAQVARLFAAYHGRYGSPRITAELRAAGWRVSENTVAQLMAEHGLRARPPRRRRHTTRPGRGRWRAPDLVGRRFAADGLNRRWYGDGTEIATGEGKLHLASVLDMGSRRIVGFALSAHHDAALAYAALAMAVAVRGGREVIAGVVLHTDQGSELRLNLSSQHLDREVCYGARARLGRGSDGQAADAVTGSPTGRPQETSAIVLDSDRTGGDKYRCRAHGRRVAGPRHSVVPRMWRSDTSVGFPRGFGPVPVVRRA
jgi:hypothetical protein